MLNVYPVKQTIWVNSIYVIYNVRMKCLDVFSTMSKSTRQVLLIGSKYCNKDVITTKV